MKFESLVSFLDGSFEKAYPRLTKAQKKRVDESFNLVAWQMISPLQRRQHAEHWDALHDPALAEVREEQVQVPFRIGEIDGEILELESMSPTSITEKELRRRRLFELKAEKSALTSPAACATIRTQRDYRSFLTFDDGRVWTLLPDARKLVAGYLPFSDDDDNLNPTLRAPNNRVLVTERGLIGAHTSEATRFLEPTTRKSGDATFVDMKEYLVWFQKYNVVADLGIVISGALWDAVLVELAVGRSGGNSETQAYWEAFYERLTEQKRKLAEAEALKADTATELERKEARIETIQRTIRAMEEESDFLQTPFGGEDGDLTEQEPPPSRYTGEPIQYEAPPDLLSLGKLNQIEELEPPPSQNINDYLPYEDAIDLLRRSFADVTAEEIAAWVWEGPNGGGLRAFVPNHESIDRFHYIECEDPRPADRQRKDPFNYVEPILKCVFLRAEIDQFKPADRYWSSDRLLNHWRGRHGDHVEAFICAKIELRQLKDFAPIWGTTQWMRPGDNKRPPSNKALFHLSKILSIDAASGKSIRTPTPPPPAIEPTKPGDAKDPRPELNLRFPWRPPVREIAESILKDQPSLKREALAAEIEAKIRKLHAEGVTNIVGRGGIMLDAETIRRWGLHGLTKKKGIRARP